MNIESIFFQLSRIFDGPRAIETTARNELLKAKSFQLNMEKVTPLPPSIVEAMKQADADPVCDSLLQFPFDWAPPQTSLDPLYTHHSSFKSHIELLGPDGLLKSEVVRLGLYGMLPESEYGIRTHEAEEIYIMLAGECFWKVGEFPYQAKGIRERSYHSSMMPHASKTNKRAFMSVYVWSGEISTDNYVYKGIPDEK